VTTCPGRAPVEKILQSHEIGRSFVHATTVAHDLRET
jgi:hypothetical protein